MTTVNDIYSFLCELAPLNLQLSFDNSGIQTGYMGKLVKTALLSLDITDDCVSEAIDCGAELIITHHPLLFHPARSITDIDPESARLQKIIANGLSVISMHTNLDITDGGVNDVLIALLGAEGSEPFEPDNCGRAGMLRENMHLKEFIALCKESLNVKCIRYYNAGRPVRKIAVLGGAGSGSLEDAYKAGCDTFVTSDISYHYFLRAMELGINLIDADHFCTENPVMYMLQSKLREKFGDTDFIVSKRHHQIIDFA